MRHALVVRRMGGVYKTNVSWRRRRRQQPLLAQLVDSSFSVCRIRSRSSQASTALQQLPSPPAYDNTLVQDDDFQHRRPTIGQQQRQQHHRRRYAVLIDAENSQRAAMGLILEHIYHQLQGEAIVRLVYGDFSREHATWRQVCLEHAILPVHSFSYVPGKGNTDATLILDAMELLYSSSPSVSSQPSLQQQHNPKLDGICIVSSDSDFTRLALTLREAGLHVVGYGQGHAPSPFVQACHDFVLVNQLVEEDQSTQHSQLQRRRHKRQDIQIAAQEDTQLPRKDEPLVEQDNNNDGTDQTLFTYWDATIQFFRNLWQKDSRLIDRSKNTVNNVLDDKTSSRSSVAIQDSHRTQQECTRGTTSSGSLSQEDLDDLHSVWAKYCNHDGYVNPSVFQQKCSVDPEAYGYERLSDLIVNQPDHFETVVTDRTLFVRCVMGKTTVPIQVLETLRCIWLRFRNGQGYCNVSVLVEFSKVNPRAFGYKKMHDLLEEYPFDFQLKRELDGIFVKCLTSPCSGVKRETDGVSMKSLKSPQTDISKALEMIHTAIVENAHGDSDWAYMGKVAGSCRHVHLSYLGYDKLSQFIRDYPDEFKVKWEGSTGMFVKSTNKNAPDEEETLEQIHKAIAENAEDSGWAYMGDIVKSCPEVNVSEFGYDKLSQFMRKQHPNEFVFKMAADRKLYARSFTPVTDAGDALERIDAAVRTYADESGWAYMGEIADYCRNVNVPGYDKLSRFIWDRSTDFEVKREGRNMYVRKKKTVTRT